MNHTALLKRIKRFYRACTGSHCCYSFFRPSIDGGVLWVTECNTCQASWNGFASDRDEAEQAAHAIAGPGDVWKINGLDTPNTRRRFQDLPAVQYTVKQHPTIRHANPYVLATDGAHDPHKRRSGWAYVTGAGWHNSGMYRDTNREGAVQRAELMAILEGLSLFPKGSPVEVVYDATVVGDYLRAVYEGEPYQPKWVGQGLHEYVLGSRKKDRAVSMRWTPRERNYLQWYADKLAFAAARPFEWEKVA